MLIFVSTLFGFLFLLIGLSFFKFAKGYFPFCRSKWFLEIKTRDFIYSLDFRKDRLVLNARRKFRVKQHGIAVLDRSGVVSWEEFQKKLFKEIDKHIRATAERDKSGIELRRFIRLADKLYKAEKFDKPL